MNPDPRDISWGLPALPDWVTSFRDHQVQAVEEILEAFRRGTKVVLLDAPTGSGKTLIAEMVRRHYQSSLYLCTTKQLQDQFITDFPYARTIKGRDNYPTELQPALALRNDAMRVTCADCVKDACPWCSSSESCPYTKAKTRAKQAPVAVLNTAYAIRETSSRYSKFNDRDLCIIDEADLLENAVMGYVEVSISPYRQKKLGIKKPAKKTVKESWVSWVLTTIPKVSRALDAIPADTHDPRQLKERRYLAGLLTNLKLLHTGLTDPDGPGWVYTGYDTGYITFKPVRIDHLAPDVVWHMAPRFLCMSASLISPAEFAESLGLRPDEVELVRVGSTFPPERRPVYLTPVDNITAKNYDQALPALAEMVEAIIASHPGERILVHTVSYKLAKDLGDRLSSPRIVSYASGREKDAAIARYRDTEGAVMLAPSMDRGVDLPYDACDVQVIAKVPFPYLGDKQVAARMHSRGGQLWYQVQTVRTLVQMTGRGMRHADDRCTTYVLDKQFLRLYRQAGKLFPQWWKDAVVSTGEKRQELLEMTSTSPRLGA